MMNLLGSEKDIQLQNISVLPCPPVNLKSPVPLLSSSPPFLTPRISRYISFRD